MVNRDRRERGEKPYNRKRIRRVMRMMELTLPGKLRRRINRAHTGKIVMPDSNQRWCSDGFNIKCWNGEVVQVAFALVGDQTILQGMSASASKEQTAQSR